MSDNEEPKVVRRSMSKRVQDRLAKSLKFGLPKVRRARGLSLNLPRPRLGSKNRPKSKEIKKPVIQREPAPEVTEKLKEVLSGNYALWLGQDFSSLLGKSIDLSAKLTELVKLIKEPEKRQEVLVILQDQKAGSLTDAKKMLIDELGVDRFNSLLETVIDDSSPETTLPFKLIKSLKPSLIFYEGVDRSLEAQLKHDNIDVQSLTGLDLLSLAEINAEIKNSSQSTLDCLLSDSMKQVIIKPNGDITKPETLNFTSQELFAKYGLNLDGSLVADNEMISEARFMTAFMAEVSQAMPIVFIGSSLAETDPMSFYMKTIYPNAGEDKKGDDAELNSAIKHFALVSPLAQGLGPRFPSSEIGIDYLTYTPDKEFSQVTEFLAKMASASSVEIEETLKPGTVSHKAFVNGYGKYINGLVAKELEAKTASFFVNDLTALPLTLDDKFLESIVRPVIEAKYKEEDRANVMEAIENREKSLEAKVLAPPVEVTKETEEKKEGIVPEQDMVMRVLVPRKAGGLITGEAMISKAEKLLAAMEASNGRLEIRVVESEEEKVVDDFEILFFQGEAGVGDVCLVYESHRKFFDVAWFDQNTNEAEEKVLLFERMWNAALRKNESMIMLKQAIADGKAGKNEVFAKQAEQQKPTRLRRRWFSKGSKDKGLEEIQPEKEEVVKDTEEGKKGKSKSKRIRGFTRMGRGSKKDKKNKNAEPGSPNAKTEEVAVEKAKNEEAGEEKKDDANATPAAEKAKEVVEEKAVAAAVAEGAEKKKETSDTKKIEVEKEKKGKEKKPKKTKPAKEKKPKESKSAKTEPKSKEKVETEKPKTAATPAVKDEKKEAGEAKDIAKEELEAGPTPEITHEENEEAAEVVKSKAELKKEKKEKAKKEKEEKKAKAKQEKEDKKAKAQALKAQKTAKKAELKAAKKSAEKTAAESKKGEEKPEDTKQEEKPVEEPKKEDAKPVEEPKKEETKEVAEPGKKVEEEKPNAAEVVAEVAGATDEADQEKEKKPKSKEEIKKEKEVKKAAIKKEKEEKKKQKAAEKKAKQAEKEKAKEAAKEKAKEASKEKAATPEVEEGTAEAEDAKKAKAKPKSKFGFRMSKGKSKPKEEVVVKVEEETPKVEVTEEKKEE